jgi:hypothetical protein
VPALADLAGQLELGACCPVGGQQVGPGLHPVQEGISKGFRSEVDDKMIVGQLTCSFRVLLLR